MACTHNDRVDVQRAGDADAAAVLAVLHAAFEEYRGKLDPPSGVHRETRQTILAKLRDGWAVVAKVDGEVVGCAFGKREDDRVWLGRLAVLPEFRRRGIARALIGAIERTGRALGARSVRLGVRMALPGLQAWYERLGYHAVASGTHEGYSQPTYVIMEKPLTGES